MLAIDFDDTLNFTPRNQKEFVPNLELINILKGKEFSILTARYENKKNIDYIKKFIDDYKLSPKAIYYTNGLEKGPFMSNLDLTYLVDDKEYHIPFDKI